MICRAASVEATTQLKCLVLARERFVGILGPLYSLMQREKSPAVVTQRLMRLQTKVRPCATHGWCSAALPLHVCWQAYHPFYVEAAPLTDLPSCDSVPEIDGEQLMSSAALRNSVGAGNASAPARRGAGEAEEADTRRRRDLGDCSSARPSGRGPRAAGVSPAEYVAMLPTIAPWMWTTLSLKCLLFFDG